MLHNLYVKITKNLNCCLGMKGHRVNMKLPLGQDEDVCIKLI